MARFFGKGFSKFDKEIAQKVVEMGHQTMAVHYYLKMCAAFRESEYCEIGEVKITLKELQDALKMRYTVLKSCLNALLDGKIIEFKEFGRGKHAGSTILMLDHDVTNVTSDMTNVTSDMTNVTSDMTNVTSDMTNVTHKKIEDIKKIRTEYTDSLKTEDKENLNKIENPLPPVVADPPPVVAKPKKEVGEFARNLRVRLMAIYDEHYPRKGQPSRGISKLIKQIKNEPQLQSFEKAVKNYANQMKYEGRGSGYIMGFSRFCEPDEWCDFVDYNPNEHQTEETKALNKILEIEKTMIASRPKIPAWRL